MTEAEQDKLDAGRYRAMVKQGKGRMHTMFDGSYYFDLPQDKAKADDFVDCLIGIRQRAEEAKKA